MLSVIIAALNSERTIEITLSSIFSNRLPNTAFEVILVDNGSTDTTIQIANKSHARVFSCAKRGQGAARNLGIKQARGEILCFTDADVLVPHNWLAKILAFFTAHPEVDGVGGPVLAPTEGYVNNLQELEGALYTRTHRFPSVMMECQLGDKRSSHYSANCAYRREVLTSAQGFDDSGLDAVDTELCWRLLLMKKRCVFNPELQVIHLGFPWSLSGVFRQQFRWGKSQALLNRRFQLGGGLKERILPYSSLILSFLRIPCSKSRRYGFLQLFERLAFHCGYLCSSFKNSSGRLRLN